MTSTGFIAMRLRPLLAAVRHTAFIRGAHASDEDALAIVVAHYFQWDGVRILATFEKALDDANFHREASQVRVMLANCGTEDA